MADYLAEGARWLRQAEQDLEDAKYLKEGGRHNLACFMGQQRRKKLSKPICTTSGSKTSGATPFWTYAKTPNSST